MVKMVSRDELRKMIDKDEKFRLVDVLDRPHFETEHIKGAINIPVNEIEKEAEKILTDKNETIVTYCASFDCKASTNAANKLLAMGYKNVWDYKGGLKDYKEANLPLEGCLHAKASKATSSCKSC